MYLGLLIYILIYSIFGLCTVAEYGTSLKYNSEKVAIHRKMPWILILSFSIVCALFNYYSTSISAGMGSDRKNYLFDFNGFRSASVGLDIVFAIVKFFSGDIYTAFYLTTFLCCLITFYAYRKLPDADYNTILFLLSTNFVVFTFTGLKQCYACAFAALFFAFAFRERTKRNVIVCIILIIVASMFHSTGFILVPVYMFILFSPRKSGYINLTIILLILVAIFIQPISLVVARVVEGPFPQLASTITQYLGSESSFGTQELNITALQGFPFYILIVLGLLNRKMISKVEPRYDMYLVLAALGGLFYILSFFSYWMSRFSSIFFIPMGILYAMNMKYMSRNNRLVISALIVVFELILTLRSYLLVYSLWGGF